MQLDETEKEVLATRWGLYVLAIEAWGVDAQIDMIIEESAELIKALLKYRRDPNIDRKVEILEEIADAEIMLEQARTIFDTSNDVERMKADKLKRLHNRLGWSMRNQPRDIEGKAPTAFLAEEEKA